MIGLVVRHMVYEACMGIAFEAMGKNLMPVRGETYHEYCVRKTVERIRKLYPMSIGAQGK